MNASRTRDDLGWYPPHIILFNGCLILDAKRPTTQSDKGVDAAGNLKCIT